MNSVCRNSGNSSTLRALAAQAARASAVQLAVLLSFGSASLAVAQSVQLTPRVTAAAIGCAPSGNGTGHMICVEYGQAGSLVGVSWQAPPAINSGPGTNPAGMEPIGTLHMINPLATAAGALVGAPGCATANANTGTVSCLIVSKGSGGLILQGVALSPPANIGSATLQALGTLPTAVVASNPSCVPAGHNNDNVIACSIVIDGQVYGIAFDALNNTVHTALTSLSIANVTGAPGCSAALVIANPPTALCAVRQGGGLLGFSFQYDAVNNGVDGVTTVSLGAHALSGDPSCAIRGDLAVSCAIVDGAALLGISFNPTTQAPPSAYQSLGSAPDGNWTGAVACAPFNDVRHELENLNANLVGCAALSNTGKLFQMSFDPATPRALGVNGAFAVNLSSSLNCLELAINTDQLYCGGIDAAGAAVGVRLPTGLLPPAVSVALKTLL